MRISALPSEARFALVRNRAALELPIGATCRGCLIGEPLVLKLTDDGHVLCRECLAVGSEMSPLQVHHLGGRWDTEHTVTVGANLHAVLTLLQDCFWRGAHKPGSAYAVAFDLGAYLAYTSFEEEE